MLSRTDKEITDIYERNADSVYRVACLYMGNRLDAEDIMQTVFLKYIDSDIIFSGEGHERAWFITVTKNACKDVLKSAWRSRRDDILTLDNTWDLSYTDTYRYDSELINHIKKLKTNYKMVLYLYYYEEYSVREISGIMGRKESTIQTWLLKGREKLRKQMGGESVEESI